MARMNEGIDLSQTVITIDDIAGFLRDKKIVVSDEDFPDKAKSELFNFFNARGTHQFRSRQFTLDETRRFLTKAKNATVLLGQYLPKSRVDEMVETIKKLDENTIEQLNKIYTDTFNLYSGDKIATDEGNKLTVAGLSKSMSTIVKTIIGEASAKSRQGVTAELDRLTAAFFIYKELKPYLEVKWDKKTQQVVRKVDEKVLKIVSADYFKGVTTKQTKEIFEALTSGLDKDRLSKKEVAELITHTGSVLTTSSKSRIEACQECLQKYREHLIQLARDDKKFEQYVNEYVTLKNLAVQAGTIIRVPEETQYQMFDVLTGKTLGELTHKYDIQLRENDPASIGRVKSFKVNFTPVELFYILVNESSKALTTATPNTMLNIALSFNRVVERVFPDGSNGGGRLKREDFKLEEFVTGKNFSDLVSDSVFTNRAHKDIENYVANIKTLNKVMRGSEVFKVMQSNHMLFMADNAEISQRLNQIIKECNGDIGLLSEQVNSFVNESFNSIIKGKSTENTTPSKKRRGVASELKEFFVQTPIQVEVDGGIEKATTTTKTDVKIPKTIRRVDAPTNPSPVDVKDIATPANNTNTSSKPTKKVKTFSDVLQGSDVSDKCINLLKQEVEQFKDMLNNLDEAGSLDKAGEKSKLNAEEILTVKIKRIAKLVDKSNELLSKEDGGFIKDLKQTVLQDCEKDIKQVYNSVKGKVESLKSIISASDVKRGKKLAKTSEEAGELLDFMSNMATSAKQSKNESNKKLMLDALRKVKEQTKDEIASSQKSANQTRMDNYDEAINYLRQYSTYNKVLNVLENELPELFSEATLGL